MPTRVCPICSDDHLYRECEHPCIQQYHNLCLEIHISLIVNSRFYRACENICNETPPGVARAMILKYTPRDMLSSQFVSIYQWRTSYDDVEQDEKKLPSRVGIISSASRVDLRNMLSLIYSRLALDAYNDVSPNHAGIVAHGVPLYTNRIRQADMAEKHATNVATALMNFSRKLKNTINITPEGVTEVISNLTQFLTTTIVDMENNKIEPTIPGNSLQTGLRPNHIDTSFIPTLNEIINDGNDPRHMSTIRPYAVMQRITQYSDSILPPGAAIPAHSRLADLRAPPPIVHQTPYSGGGGTRNRPQPKFHVNMNRNLQTELPSIMVGDSCGICWDNMTITNACRTDCNHNFCAGCMTQHIRATRTRVSNSLRHAPLHQSTDTDLNCPMCRYSIKELTYYSEHDDILTHILDMRIMLDTYTPHAAAEPTPPNNPFDNIVQQILTDDHPTDDLLQELIGIAEETGTPLPITIQEMQQIFGSDTETGNNTEDDEETEDDNETEDDDETEDDEETDDDDGVESVIINIPPYPDHPLLDDEYNIQDEWSQVSV